MPTKALNQAVKRNLPRFPPDFMFQLNASEKAKMLTITTTTDFRGHTRTKITLKPKLTYQAMWPWPSIAARHRCDESCSRATRAQAFFVRLG
jgi:hypothetical protein